MSCNNSGTALKNSILNYYDIYSVAPTTGGQIMQGLAAKLRGETIDFSLGDYWNATGLDNVVAMAKAQAALNNGKMLTSIRHEVSPTAKDAKKVIDQNMDANPDGGSDTCEEPDQPPPPPPPPSSDSLPPPRGGDDNGDGSNGGGRNKGGGGSEVPLQRKDPLVIDLGGDGLSLTNLNGSNVHFDFEGDGFAELTGWVSASDALVVLDINGNGIVDSGLELLGRDGLDGFDALAQLDSNCDGKVDSGDADFSLLKIWQDSNQDGISQSSEMIDPTALGITSFGVARTAVNATIEGNWVANSGAAMTAAGTSLSVSSVYFTVNKQATQFVAPEDFAFHELAEILPHLKGYGMVADLQVAISLNTDLRDYLVGFVRLSDGISATDYRAGIEVLLQKWVGTDAMAQTGRGSHVDYDKLNILEAFWGQPFWQQDISAGNAQFIDTLFDRFLDDMSASLLPQLSLGWYNLRTSEGDDVGFLEHSLSAFSVFDYDVDTNEISGRLDYFLALATDGLSGTDGEKMAQFEALMDFTPMMSSLLFGGGRDVFDGQLSGLVSPATNYSGLPDATIFYEIRNNLVLGNDANDNLVAHAASGRGFYLAGGSGDDVVNGNGNADVVDGGSGQDSMSGNGGDDVYVFHRGFGQDVIEDQGGGAETIYFGPTIAASDISVVQGNNGQDLILKINGTTDQVTLQLTMDNSGDRIERVMFADGTVLTHAQLVQMSMLDNGGNDIFYGSYDGEALNGGLGDDRLNGNGGADTYIYNVGDGDDVIFDYRNFDSSVIDTLAFGEGINPADIVFSRVATDSNDIRIGFAGQPGSIIFDNQWWDDAGIEKITFADGTVWTEAEIASRYVAAQTTSGNDTIWGSLLADTISGGDGDDLIDAGNGNDTIEGGTGDDSLLGKSGTDTASYASAESGVTVSLALTTAQNTVGAGTDTLNSIENLTGSAFGDTLTGSTAVNVISGGDGDDLIAGGAGNDTINGGAGADTAKVAGDWTTYTLQTVSGQVKLVDNNTSADGNDGTDTLVGIESVQFKDQSMGIVSPIILDLNGDGIRTISAARSHSTFDMDGDGRNDDTSWISATDGFLFLDRDGNGTASGIEEMSFVGDLPEATSDLEGLRAFDSNRDGTLSAADDCFNEFGIWRDRNGDGVVDHGEILSFDAIGLRSIDLTGNSHTSFVNPGDVAVLNIGTWTRSDGISFEFADAAMTFFEGVPGELPNWERGQWSGLYEEGHERDIDGPHWLVDRPYDLFA